MSDKTTTINSQKITLVKINKTEDGELSERIHYDCAFCERTSSLYRYTRRMYEKLSGDNFYCNFCLRHRFNTKNNKNILILSFRSIVGYYYYEKYIPQNNRELWMSQINDYVESHIETGLLNPLFVYDPESMYWFVDFSRVGKGRKKLRIAEIHKTISNILLCFNLKKHVPDLKIGKFYEKYSEAINKFYTHRYRPDDKRILIPTFAQCGVYDTNKKYSLENTRTFGPSELDFIG